MERLIDDPFSFYPRVDEGTVQFETMSVWRFATLLLCGQHISIALTAPLILCCYGALQLHAGKLLCVEDILPLSMSCADCFVGTTT